MICTSVQRENQDRSPLVEDGSACEVLSRPSTKVKQWNGMQQELILEVPPGGVTGLGVDLRVEPGVVVSIVNVKSFSRFGYVSRCNAKIHFITKRYNFFRLRLKQNLLLTNASTDGKSNFLGEIFVIFIGEIRIAFVLYVKYSCVHLIRFGIN